MTLDIKKNDFNQLISWGHWFTFFNIIICILIGSSYMFLSDWPVTFLGRIYAIVSCIGHFSILPFLVYLVTLFPLTFILRTFTWLRVIAVILAMLGVMLLVLDVIVYAYFQLHINLTIFQLFTAYSGHLLAWNKYIVLLITVGIFVAEWLLASLIWRKIRQLKQICLKVVIVSATVFSIFFSQFTHLWADANFYRPITMQRRNLPLSYPLTARHLLNRYGLLDERDYQEKLMIQGNPFSIAIEYPLASLQYKTKKKKYNLLMIVVDGIRNQDMDKDMPYLTQLSTNYLRFNRHYSSGNNNEMSTFSLFYGISPNYYEAVLGGKMRSALLNMLLRQEYNISFFAAEGFESPLFKQALLSDFSVSSAQKKRNNEIVVEWGNWLEKQAPETPWFAYVNFDNDSKLSSESTSSKQYIDAYRIDVARIDEQIQSIITKLQESYKLNQTVVVITANHGIEFDDTKSEIWGYGKNYSEAEVQVPLVVLWPEKPAAQIDKLTGHSDIMRTLMQELLTVTSDPDTYSQGDNLFSRFRPMNWVAGGDKKNLVVFTDDHIIIIDNKGRYKIYDKLSYQWLSEEKLSLPLFLQILTETKRFVAG